MFSAIKPLYPIEYHEATHANNFEKIISCH
jgi:hypothetical protein